MLSRFLLSFDFQKKRRKMTDFASFKSLPLCLHSQKERFSKERRWCSKSQKKNALTGSSSAIFQNSFAMGYHFYFSFLELLSQFYDYVEIISLLFNFQGNRNDSAYQSSYFIVYHSIIILLFVCIKNVTYHATPSFSH